MSAVYQSMTVARGAGPREVRAAFNRWRRDNRFAISEELDIRIRPPFATRDEAEEWMSRNSAKSTPALAVAAWHHGQEVWVIGAWCDLRDWLGAAGRLAGT